MDTQKTTFERELFQVEKDLEKEKTKRTILLIIVNAVLVAVLLYDKNVFNSLKDVLLYLGGSLFLGGCLFFFSTASFVFVSKIFTNVDAIESRKRYLEEKIRSFK